MSGTRTDYSLAAPSERAVELQDRMLVFMHEHVLPAEARYLASRRKAGPDDHVVPPVIDELKKQAQALGLWNLFLPAESGLTQLEYAPIAELSGWSNDLAPEAINCQAPDTGNMELLHLLGTEQQKHAWLEPLLAGRIRSAFAMTEPDVASSDATNIATRIERDGDEYVITGRKWWTSGAMDPRCAVLIVMGKTDPAAPAHRQQTMVLVPRIPRASPSSGTIRCSATTTSTGTPRSASTPPGFRSATWWARREAASPLLRPGSARAASTIACARSAPPNVRWR